MRARLETLLAADGPLGGRPLMADGATGTNYFQMGLTSGEPPESWITEHPDRVRALHQRFVDAGSDIILTNSFGGNRHRLKLHNAQDQVYELAKRAAELAVEVAEAAERPVVVGGSVGPTGELLVPLGELSAEDAQEAFVEQMRGLADGGADVMWIETMSAPDEMLAAARAAISLGLPYVVTASFDTAGRTMMGLLPEDLASTFAELPVQPLAIGANCGVGASDILVSVLHMSAADVAGAPGPVVISKGNCGIPEFHGTEIHYSGTPELMGRYATLAADAGAHIIGGCCGTSPEHLESIRASLDSWVPGDRPVLGDIVETIGPLVNSVPTEQPARGSSRTSRSRRRS
jgi:5-methyltetrahydrofolate--homocysteine methyltransferase